MLRLLCPFWYARTMLRSAYAVELFIKHDATLLRVEAMLQKSQDENRMAARRAEKALIVAAKSLELAAKGKE